LVNSRREWGLNFPIHLFAPLGVAVRHPDEMFLELLDSAADEFCAAARLQRQALKQPPMTVDQSLAKLAAVSLRHTARRFSTYPDRL
jgi:hypothetical protein